MPGFMLSRIFRVRLRTALRHANLGRECDPAVWNRKWTVHVQQIGRGEQAALYLSRYIYRVAISNDRIERFANDQVTFRYTNARSRQTQCMSLPAHLFIDRFLQHVLPRGFSKVRSYGLLSPTHRKKLEQARHLLRLHATPHSDPASTSTESSTTADPNPSFREPDPCPVCHCGQLRFVLRFPPSRAPP
jgi:hypothetical protein